MANTYMLPINMCIHTCIHILRGNMGNVFELNFCHVLPHSHSFPNPGPRENVLEKGTVTLHPSFEF